MKRIYKYKGPIFLNGKLSMPTFTATVTASGETDACHKVCDEFKKAYYEKFKDSKVNKMRISAFEKYLTGLEYTS